MAVLCRYRYDPLDRLASSAPTDQPEVRCFYQQSLLATQIQGAVQRTVFQHGDQLLAQRHRTGKASETSLLAIDQQRSVLQCLNAAESEALAYTAYGHHPADSGLSCLLGFAGERRDSVTGHYLLGNGYRAFNPLLMRFNSPDSLSPFAEGGLNAYVYCQGDPVNFRDPTGHITRLFYAGLARVGFLKPPQGVVLKRLVSRPISVVATPVSTVNNVSAIQSVPGRSSTRVADAMPAPASRPPPAMRVQGVMSDADKLAHTYNRKLTRSPPASNVSQHYNEATKVLARHDRAIEMASYLISHYQKKANGSYGPGRFARLANNYTEDLARLKRVRDSYLSRYNATHALFIRRR